MTQARYGRRSRRRNRSLSTALVAAFVLAGTANAQVGTSRQGRASPVADTSRVATLGGDITEILYALGLGSRIAAVDSTSQFPPTALAEKRNVGYVRALSAEGVLSTAPTLILATDRAGPPEAVAALKASGVAYVEIADTPSPEGVASKVRTIAQVMGAEAQGEALVRDITASFATLNAARAAITRPVRALFVLSVENGRATIGGVGTSADAVLRLAGAVNAGAEVPGFRQITDEALLALAPDVFVVMRRGDNRDTTSPLLALPGASATPAGKARRVVVMDGLSLLGFGPRAPQAARDLMDALYPPPATR